MNIYFVFSWFLPRLLHRDIDMDGARQVQKEMGWLNIVNVSLLPKKPKLLRLACFQLISKRPPLQKFSIFVKYQWFSSLLSGSALCIYFSHLPFFQYHKGYQPQWLHVFSQICLLPIVSQRQRAWCNQE